MADSDKLYQDAINQINGVETPDINAMRLKLQTMVQQGIITPEQAHEKLISGNAFDNISTDPNMMGAEQDALAQLQNVGEGGGFNATDKARIQGIEDDLNTTERGRQEAIMQNARERGIGGGNMEMAARLISEQGGADRAAKQGTDAAAQAEQRALAAMQESGQLAGQIHGQQYGEGAQKASASNAIDAANAEMKNQFNMWNAQQANAAQAQNLAEKQRISDANTNTKNVEQAHNANLGQVDFENKLKKAEGSAGVMDQWAGEEAKSNSADKAFENQLTAGLIQTGARAGAGAMGGPVAAAAPSFAPSNPTEAAFDNDHRTQNYSKGGIVPGKARKPGDSPVNDTVPARLSPGEAVIPRSEVQKHPDIVAAFTQHMGRRPKPSEVLGHDDIAKVLHALGSLKAGGQ
jgi:hypothetical protein